MEKQLDAILRFLNRFSASFEMNQLTELIKKQDMDGVLNNGAYKALKEALDHKTPTVLNPDEILYRCRAIDFQKGLNGISEGTESMQFTGYNAMASGAPMLGMSQSGRSNIAGVSYLYLAEDEYTACAEIKPQLFQFVSVAQYVVQKPLNLYDFSTKQFCGDDCVSIQAEEYSLFFSMYFGRPAYTSANYLVPQLFAEMVRERGYDGICYRSIYSGKKNYTLFHFSDKYIRFKESRPLFASHGSLNIYDINASCNITSPVSPLKIPEDQIKKILQDEIKKQAGSGEGDYNG